MKTGIDNLELVLQTKLQKLILDSVKRKSGESSEKSDRIELRQAVARNR